jgi:hypothetical protein
MGRGLGPRRFQGIRFRLGLWLAFALLPLLILGGFQAQSAFRAQDAGRRADLQQAAERNAADARALLTELNHLHAPKALLRAWESWALLVSALPAADSLDPALEADVADTLASIAAALVTELKPLDIREALFRAQIGRAHV